jgi:hypothetical protein
VHPDLRITLWWPHVLRLFCCACDDQLPSPAPVGLGRAACSADGARWLGGMASLLLPIAMAALCGSATVAASTSNLNARLLRGEYVLRCLTWTGSLVVSFVYITGPLIEVLPCWSEQVPRFCGASATGTTDIVL